MIKKQLYILLFLCSFITVHAEGIDRGIRKTTFIPKGQWMLGGTFSYSEHTDDNYRNIVLTDVTVTAILLRRVLSLVISSGIILR